MNNDNSNIFTADVQPGAKVLYFYLQKSPGIYSQAELAMCIGATTQSVNAYVKALKREGYVKVEEAGRRFTYGVV